MARKTKAQWQAEMESLEVELQELKDANHEAAQLNSRLEDKVRYQESDLKNRDATILKLETEIAVLRAEKGESDSKFEYVIDQLIHGD